MKFHESTICRYYCFSSTFSRLAKIDRNIIHINLALAIAIANGLFIAADSVFKYQVIYEYMSNSGWCKVRLLLEDISKVIFILLFLAYMFWCVCCHVLHVFGFFLLDAGRRNSCVFDDY